MVVSFMGSTHRLLHITLLSWPVTKPLMTSLQSAALWCHMVLGRLGEVSNEDLAVVENNQFVISIECYFNWNTYSGYKMWNESATFITFSFCWNSFKQPSLFISNLARLSDSGTSPLVVVRGHQFCLKKKKFLSWWNEISSRVIQTDHPSGGLTVQEIHFFYI